MQLFRRFGPRAMRYLLVLLTLLWGPIVPVQAQSVTTPPAVALVCAYNLSPITAISGQFFFVQCDDSGRLLVASDVADLVPGTSAAPCSTAGSILYSDGTLVQCAGATKATSIALGAGSPITSSGPGGALTALAYTNPNTIALANLSATTSAIGGGLLTAGTCATGTVAVANSTTSMTVSVSPNTYPGDGTLFYGYVSTNGTVTVKACAIVALTPTSSTYNVRVIQ